MIKKKLIILLVCMTMVFVNTSFVLANSNSEKIENIYIEKNDEEYNYIEEVYTQNSERILQFAIDYYEVSDVKNKNINELKFHKVYSPKQNINYYDEFQKSNSLKDIISDYYYMESLVYDKKDNVVSSFRIRKMPDYDELISLGYEFEEETANLIKEKEGKYILASQGLYIPSEWYKVINDPIQLELLIDAQLKDEKISNISILSLNAYNMYLIFIEGESNEYGIPLTHREDFLNLENGKLYEINDIVNSWNSYFNSNSLGGNSNSNILVSNNNNILFIVLGFLTLVVGLLLIKKIKKSKHNM